MSLGWIALLTPLLVPTPPDGASTALQTAWVSLQAIGPAGGWAPKLVEEPPGDPSELAARHAAGGVLWADQDGATLRLLLYRRRDARLFEDAVDLSGDPGPAALREAVRLRLDFLLEARGGRPWKPAPPLPRAPPPLGPEALAALRVGAPVPYPRRAPPVVPDPPPPLPEPRPEGAEVRVVARPDEAPPYAPPPPGGWSVTVSAAALVDDEIDPGFGLGVGRVLSDQLELRFGFGAFPFGADGAVSTLHGSFTLEYLAAEGPVGLAAALGGFYEGLTADAGATVEAGHRGGALAGLELRVPIGGLLSAGVRAELLAGSNALEARVGGARHRQGAVQGHGGVFLTLRTDEAPQR